ncbi:hypothetical protein PS1_025968 [Malus domestica]
MWQVNDPGLYLEIPSNWDRLKRHALAYVKSRALERSKAGSRTFSPRLEAEPSLADTAIPRIPISESMLAQFWWRQKEDERKIHWCRRVINEPESFWVPFSKARYFPTTSFIEAKRGHRASWAWASLLKGRDIISGGAHWQVMNGQSIQLWVDRWLL